MGEEVVAVKSIEISDGKESWNAKVRSPENLGKCQEIRIESRSGITLIIGKYSSGWFACMPDFKVGVGLLGHSAGNPPYFNWEMKG